MESDRDPYDKQIESRQEELHHRQVATAKEDLTEANRAKDLAAV